MAQDQHRKNGRDEIGNHARRSRVVFGDSLPQKKRQNAGTLQTGPHKRDECLAGQKQHTHANH